MAEKPGVNLFDRDAFVEGGGLLDDVDVTFTSVRFGKTDYRGSAATTTTALLVTMETEDGEEHEEIYSIGRKAEKVLMASPDGSRLVPRSGASEVQLNSKSKAGMFLISLIDAGYENEGDPKDISQLEGLRVHVRRKALPKLDNVADSKEGSVLLVADILEEKSKGKATGKAAAKGKAADNGFDDKVAELIATAAAESDEPLTMGDLRRALYKATKGEDDSKEIIIRATEEDFYDRRTEFDYDKKAGTVAMA